VEGNGRLIKHEINVKTASIYDVRGACRRGADACARPVRVSAFSPFGRDSISRKRAN